MSLLCALLRVTYLYRSTYYYSIVANKNNKKSNVSFVQRVTYCNEISYVCTRIWLKFLSDFLFYKVSAASPDPLSLRKISSLKPVIKVWVLMAKCRGHNSQGHGEPYVVISRQMEVEHRSTGRTSRRPSSARHASSPARPSRRVATGVSTVNSAVPPTPSPKKYLAPNRSDSWPPAKWCTGSWVHIQAETWDRRNKHFIVWVIRRNIKTVYVYRHTRDAGQHISPKKWTDRQANLSFSPFELTATFCFLSNNTRSSQKPK